MLRRLVAALSLLAFLAYGGWSEARPCAMHDGMLAQMAMSGHSTSQEATSHQHEMPGHDGSSHHCTCIGHCNARTAVAFPSTHIGWSLRAPQPRSVTPAAIAYIAVARAHARPYSTAPPRATRIA
jgi:hypothetical protein